MNVANKSNQNSSISLKLPTSKNILGTVAVPVGDWQDLKVKVSLYSTSTKIRFTFTGSSELNSFSYYPEGSEVNSEFVSRPEYERLKSTLDSTLNIFRKNVWILDSTFFKLKDDGVTITIKKQ